MAEASITPEERRQALLVVASAWIRNPRGRLRELKAAAGVLEPEEEVEMMFDLFRGAFVGRSGVLVVTKRRLIFARAFLWTTKVETILWTRVTGVETSEDRRTCDLTIHSEATIWNFWIWGRDRNELHFLEKVMKKRLAEASPARALPNVPSA